MFCDKFVVVQYHFEPVVDTLRLTSFFQSVGGSAVDMDTYAIVTHQDSENDISPGWFLNLAAYTFKYALIRNW